MQNVVGILRPVGVLFERISDMFSTILTILYNIPGNLQDAMAVLVMDAITP